MYFAKYDLEELSFRIGLCRVNLGNEKWRTDLGEIFTALAQLAYQHDVDTMLRISVQQDSLLATLGIGKSGVQIKTLQTLLKTVVESSAQNSMYADDSSDFDAWLAEPNAYKREIKSGQFSVQGVPVTVNARMYPVLSHLIAAALEQKAYFSYQIHFNKLANSAELERSARKHNLRLEDVFLPQKIRRHQQQLAKDAGKSELLIEEGFSSDSTFADYVVTQLEDEFALVLADYDLSDSPLVEDDNTLDWFETGLSRAYLEDLSLTDVLSMTISREDLTSAMSPGEQLSQQSPSAQRHQTHETAAEVEVFISYSSRNRPQAFAACQGLEQSGLRCWIAPRDITPGEEYPTAIMRGIRAAKVMLLVFSPDSNVSPHVLREVERAISLNIPVVPMLIEEAELSSNMEYLISSCHWMDALTPPLEHHVDKLTKMLRSMLAY